MQKVLRAAAKNSFDRDECYYLCGWLQQNEGEEYLEAGTCFHVMKRYFMDAVEFSWSEKEAKIIAEGLYCASLYPQLKKFAVRQQKQFADYEEYFGFMEILAVCQEGKKPISWNM